MSSGQPQWAGGLGAQPAEGDRIGPYRLEALVGTGGLASVYRAVDDAGKVVAVKVLNPARVLSEEVKRFTREYRALARMDHPNIVHVYEAGVHGGYPWIAMEYVDGPDLDTEIARWKATDPGDRWERVEQVLRGLCHGLTYVHELGLIHRDLKPGNVLLTRDGQPKISDFGVVKGGENTQSTNLTMAGRLVGTVAFMAPELITDEGVDKRTDLYALGAVLYLMCTYHRPIEADSIAGYLARHLTEIPRPAGAVDPNVPPVLERICARLLQKDRTYRYPSSAAVLQALDRPQEPDGPPMRGRDDVTNRWTTFLLDLQSRGPVRRKGLVVGLVGPDGTGRSHLLRHLIDTARIHGLKVAPSSAIGDPLGELSGVLGLPLPLAGDVEAIAGKLGHDPTVLAVDDLDRADPSVIRSIARLTRAASADRSLLVVFTARDPDGELMSLANEDGRGLPLVTIALGPVEPKAVIAMLRDRGVTGPVAPLLSRRLHTDYCGLPGPMMAQLDALVAEGWLAPAGENLRPARPLDDFRRVDLPVPASVAARVAATVAELDPAGRELVEVLALLDRPASAALLERCRATDGPRSPADVPRKIDHLIDHQVLRRTEIDADEQVTLRDPCAARVVRSTLDARRKQELHARIATALSARKRRANALEVARHLKAAGDDAAAYPLYIQAARRAAREGRFGEVIETCDAAEAVREAGEAALPAAERPKQLRWLHLLRGEALLARRAWTEAIEPLAAAAEAAEVERDPAAIARALGSLGRAYYRAGRFAEAEPLLLRSVRTVASAAEGSGDEVEHRGGALRALADIALRAGRLDEAARLWDDALRAAVATGNRDAEARARRGLAHLCAVRGDLVQSADWLGQADDLLNPDGDYRVRAGVLARAVELDTEAGRFGSAAYRAETLIDLARRHGMGERLPEAYALAADLHLRLGRLELAEEAAQQSLVFAKATEESGWEPRIRAARVLADLGRVHDALAALPPGDDLGSGGLSDPAAQYAAVCARLHAGSDPMRARDLAAWALNRPPALLVLVGTRIALDAARALIEIGQVDPARNAVKRGLKLIGAGGSEVDGLRLELLLALDRASPDPRVRDAVRQVVERLAQGLSPVDAEAVRARPAVRAAFD
ncbi:MAG: protein kinase [Myxococcota bacterium]